MIYREQFFQISSHVKLFWYPRTITIWLLSWILSKTVYWWYNLLCISWKLVKIKQCKN